MQYAYNIQICCNILILVRIILSCTFLSHDPAQCPTLFQLDEEDHIILLQWMVTWFTTDIQRVGRGGLLVHLGVWMLELTREVHCMWAYFSIHAYMSKCFHGPAWRHAWASLQTLACMQNTLGDFPSVFYRSNTQCHTDKGRILWLCIIFL